MAARFASMKKSPKVQSADGGTAQKVAPHFVARLNTLERSVQIMGLTSASPTLSQDYRRWAP